MLASAIPSVTVMPLASSCTSFPGYDNTTGIVATLKIIADSTDIDGNGFIPNLMYLALLPVIWHIKLRVTDRCFKQITILLDASANEIAVPMNCREGSLQAQPNTGINGLRRQTLVAAGTLTDSVLRFGWPNPPDPNYKLEPYIHEIDGEIAQGIHRVF
ncbi:hypothetical protein GGR58DRAFT_500255 [Xylaria digitata]|nr:hypothetical protein GGR58DRAFT_500255 [Xylaria digitata]